jgi:hypothetical protein
MVACLSRGQEIVMAPKPECKPYGEGNKTAEKDKMPFGARDGNWEQICQGKDEPRRLPSDTIKRIAAQKDTAIAPSGIRIIGAVFCSGIDLVGLDLPYSIVIDHSAVVGDIDGRNLRVKGDLSFEYALVLGKVLLNRAHVEGSVYGRNSFVKTLLVNDSQIDGTWWQTESMIFADTHFHRTGVTGDLRLDNSAFTRLWLLSSSVGGSLTLNNSEARCAYHITSSSMTYFTASNAGFGRMQSAWPDGKPGVDYPWWDRALSAKQFTRQLLDSSAVKKVADDELGRIRALRQISSRGQGKPAQATTSALPGCDDTSKSAYLEFYLFDSTVRSAFCVASFAWVAPKGALPDDDHPVTILALDGTKVGGNLIVALWSGAPTDVSTLRPGSKDYDLITGKHKFEAIGVSAGALIYDFNDNTRPYFTYIDGLNFDRIHNASPACASDTGIQLASQVELPSVDEVLQWLNKNAALSSQPFTAFAAAFERAGESPTDLRVRRQTYDLCEKTARWVPFVSRMCPRYQPPDPSPAASDQMAGARQSDAPPSPTPTRSGIGSVVSALGEWITITFGWGLYLLADHGLRPAKVVWSVLIALVAFVALFWLWLGIVGFEPKRKEAEQPSEAAPDIWPISLLFLFDRPIPLYQIREEHYAISKFFRRATRKETRTTPSAFGGPPYPMSYFGTKVLVWPATDAERRRVESWLVVLRVVGVIFTVFLLAAINTLVH